jgi:hypothetical protein
MSILCNIFVIYNFFPGMIRLITEHVILIQKILKAHKIVVGSRNHDDDQGYY